jgi:hypothetical protein
MKLKIDDAIRSMDYADLVRLHEDLKQGGHALRRMVTDKILEKEKEHGKHCAVCQSDVDPHSTTNFTLLLGPEGLKRKASFCAIDCLKYFISNIEKRKAELKKKAVEENADNQ